MIGASQVCGSWSCARQVSKCSAVNVSDMTYSVVDVRVVVLDIRLVLSRGLRSMAHNLKECCILVIRSGRLDGERGIKGCVVFM